MQLEDSDLKEFIELWQEEFGESITLEAARCRASQLLELYYVLAHPSAEPKSEFADSG